LTAHLVARDGHPEDDFLNRVAEELHDKFGIDHATIQVETGNLACALSGHV
jgi:cobalt-zinc-cadmium efflux system protein